MHQCSSFNIQSLHQKLINEHSMHWENIVEQRQLSAWALWFLFNQHALSVQASFIDSLSKVHILLHLSFFSSHLPLFISFCFMPENAIKLQIVWNHWSSCCSFHEIQLFSENYLKVLALAFWIAFHESFRKQILWPFNWLKTWTSKNSLVPSTFGYYSYKHIVRK